MPSPETQRVRSDYNIIDGEKCCWRCGASQKDAREGRASGCSAWGTYYGNHMYKATNLQETLGEGKEINSIFKE